jgi:hypothetical protein
MTITIIVMETTTLILKATAKTLIDIVLVSEVPNNTVGFRMLTLIG